jgi:hypothetical protein
VRGLEKIVRNVSPTIHRLEKSVHKPVPRYAVIHWLPVFLEKASTVWPDLYAVFFSSTTCFPKPSTGAGESTTDFHELRTVGEKCPSQIIIPHGVFHGSR